MVLHMRRSPKNLTNWGVLNIKADSPPLIHNGAKRFVLRSNVHIELSGAENLKGFEHLMMENEALEVDDP